jgi:EF hand domain-containing protein
MASGRPERGCRFRRRARARRRRGSRLCTDQEFNKIAPGETALDEEELFAKITSGKGVMPTFAEIDHNGDGKISRTEWSDFGAQRFTDAASASGGKMPNEDYSNWRQDGVYVRPID